MQQATNEMRNQSKSVYAQVLWKLSTVKADVIVACCCRLWQRLVTAMLFIKQLQNFASISLDAIVKRKQIDIFTEKLCFFYNCMRL